MIINLSEIKTGEIKLCGEESASIIDIDSAQVSFPQPIKYELRAAIVSGSLLVRGRLSTVGLFTCVDCLTQFEQTIRVDSFLVRKEIENRGGTIDLTAQIREDIILALPVKPLCQRDCAGICPRCGQNLNRNKCDCFREERYSPFSELNYKDLNL